MFGKKRNKIDSKIRFQNPRFKKHLQSARGYKRTSKSLPQTDWGVFFAKIGLDTWKARIFTVAIFAGLVYIFYIPNFLFIKTISITGLPNESLQSTETSINLFLNKKLPFPERNILLLSKNKLSNHIIQNNQKVLKVLRITKKFPSTIEVELEPRVETLKLNKNNNTYLISNDGIILSEITDQATSTLSKSGILININETEALIVGHQLLSPNLANLILDLNAKLPAITKSEITGFELPSSNNSDLTIYFNKGFKILLDTTSDINQTLNRINLLFSQFNDSDLSKLFYTDMRFEGRGYVCFKATSCIKDITLPTNNSTSTQEIIPNEYDKKQ